MNEVSASDREKDLVREKLVVRYDDVFEDLLERARKIFVLDEHGRVHLRVPQEKLTRALVIALHLMGRRFAQTAGLAAKLSMSADELERSTGAPYKTITARTSDLRRKGWLESDEQGEYRIAYIAIEDILSEVEGRITGAR